jgi:hypothetical protein
MQNFTFVIKHISGIANKVADALSRKCLLMQEFKVRTLGFDDLRTCMQMIRILRKHMKQLRTQFSETEASG